MGEFPHIAYIKSKAKIEEGKFSYQCVTFSEKEVNNAINSCNAKKERKLEQLKMPSSLDWKIMKIHFLKLFPIF